MERQLLEELDFMANSQFNVTTRVNEALEARLRTRLVFDQVPGLSADDGDGDDVFKCLDDAIKALSTYLQRARMN